jgi:hypothetical protein
MNPDAADLAETARTLTPGMVARTTMVPNNAIILLDVISLYTALVLAFIEAEQRSM